VAANSIICPTYALARGYSAAGRMFSAWMSSKNALV